jgi:hypothetical protein
MGGIFVVRKGTSSTNVGLFDWLIWQGTEGYFVPPLLHQGKITNSNPIWILFTVCRELSLSQRSPTFHTLVSELTGHSGGILPHDTP